MKYVGTELELFAGARRWKRYMRASLAPFIKGNVLEVGAGIGSTALSLCPADCTRWVCLEPDAEMCADMQRRKAAGELPAPCAIVNGTLLTIDRSLRFDTILYIDVLEHIEDDRAEIERAADYLNPGGRIVVLSPAHQWLFSPFDSSVGHFRRYTRTTLQRVFAGVLEQERIYYLDSVGLLASLGNKIALRKAVPTRAQIQLWDRAMVPLSRILDPVLGHGVGKSVVGVWRRQATPS